MRIRNVIEFGKYSFELEEKREQSLLNQSSQMITAFSVFSAVLFMGVLPVVIAVHTNLTSRIMFCAIIVLLLLIISLVLALLAQWRYGYDNMESIDVFYDEVKRKSDNYQIQEQFNEQWKIQLSQIHRSKRTLNNRRANLIKASMIVFFVAVGAVISSVIGIVFTIL